MDIPLGIICGIIAMIGWGVADFFAAKTVRKTGVFKTFVWSQIIGMVTFIAVIFFFKFPILSHTAIGLILITGFFNIVAYLAFYKGLQVGKVAIVSPVTASWVVVAVVLSLIFLNEKLTAFQPVGVVLAILGVFLTSFKLHDLLRLENLATGIWYAIIAMFSWGIHYIFIDVLVAELSWFLPILLVKTATIFYLLIYCAATKRDISFPKNVVFLVAIIGILEGIAYLAYGAGVSSKYTAIVAPIAASFPVITIILARVFLREVLEFNQKIGIVSVLVGLILLST